MSQWFGTLFTNIYSWFVTNKDTISAFVLSGQLASFVAALIMLIRQIKQVRNNTDVSKTLNKSLEVNNKIGESVELTNDNLVSLAEKIDKFRTEYDDLKNSNSELAMKLNAILEVQSIVYSTIRDDNVRMTVNSLLNNARYSEKNFKEELERKIEDIKNCYESDIQNLTSKVSMAIGDIADTINVKNSIKNTVESVDDNIRY